MDNTLDSSLLPNLHPFAFKKISTASFAIVELYHLWDFYLEVLLEVAFRTEHTHLRLLPTNRTDHQGY
jgi:hypothetical protein